LTSGNFRYQIREFLDCLFATTAPSASSTAWNGDNSSGAFAAPAVAGRCAWDPSSSAQRFRQPRVAGRQFRVVDARKPRQAAGLHHEVFRVLSYEISRGGVQLRQIKKVACFMRSRILLLSGRHDEARNLSQMLHDLPLLMDHAENLQQARAKLHQKDYQVVLTEAVLPDGKWLDVLHLVRECPDDPHVIVTSAHADGALWSEALNLGVYDLLAQPFYEPEVRRILSNACSGHVYRAHSMAAV